MYSITTNTNGERGRTGHSGIRNDTKKAKETTTQTKITKQKENQLKNLTNKRKEKNINPHNQEGY